MSRRARPFYVCASGSRASAQTAQFRARGRDSDAVQIGLDGAPSAIVKDRNKNFKKIAKYY